MNVPVFDLHCDTVTQLLGHDLAASTPLRSNQLHIDLERMKAYKGYAQCFAFWSTTGLPLPFFSSGGTSMSILMGAVALLMNISAANNAVMGRLNSEP